MSRIRKSGGYRQLRTFQTATIIYDATFWFCEKFLDRRSRTFDQMVQSARSGRQNIAEGSRASATSSHTEIRLVNVARSSFEELLLDYEDFLRHRRQPQWAKDDPRAKAVRAVAKNNEMSDLTDQERYALYSEWLDSPDPLIRANALICLIHQENYMLDKQVPALEDEFVEGGGYSENLAAERLAYRREHSKQTNRSDQTDQKEFPPCPQCGQPMVLRTAQKGKFAGKQFLGCSTYPECKGVRQL